MSPRIFCVSCSVSKVALCVTLCTSILPRADDYIHTTGTVDGGIRVGLTYITKVGLLRGVRVVIAMRGDGSRRQSGNE